jgi:hypothetical protein
MSLTHRQARQIAQAAADGLLDETARRILEAHLAGCADCRAYTDALQRLEARLAGSLQTRWPEQPPSSQEIAAAVHVIHTRKKEIHMQPQPYSPARALALGVLVVIFTLALGWGLRTLLPHPVATPAIGQSEMAGSPTEQPTPSDDLKTYTTLDGGVSVQYPAHWQLAPPESPHSIANEFRGPDGFFKLTNMGYEADDTLAQACAKEAASHPDYYGASPEIEMTTTTDGAAACFIWTSLNQDATSRSALLVEYPSEVLFSGFGIAPGTFLLLWTDPAHMSAIAPTLRFSFFQFTGGQAAPTQTPAPTPNGQGYFPGVTFDFAAEWPAAPENVMLYRLLLPEAVTEASARQVAGQLGISGQINTSPGEGSDEILYEVRDGASTLLLFNFASQFFYWPSVQSVDSEPLPFDEQVRIARQYLEAHNLLNGPYRVEPAERERSGVTFVRLLDNLPIVYGVGIDPNHPGWITVLVDSAGQVTHVTYRDNDFEAVGSYPILSAQEAWDRLLGPEAAQRLQYVILAAPQPYTYRRWTPRPSAGENTDLYGYASVIQGDPPLVQINNLTLGGAYQELAADPHPGKLLHLWGMAANGPDGQPVFFVQRWEVSPLEEQYLTGNIISREDSLWLAADDGRSLRLPYTPADIPVGEMAVVRGVIAPDQPDILYWLDLSTGVVPDSYGMTASCMGYGGGGGGSADANFGGGSFAPFNPGGPTTPPEPTPTPAYQPGTRYEALEGAITITIYRYPNRSETRRVQFGASASEALPDGLLALLAGNLEGVEAYQELPIRIWGQVTAIDQAAAMPIITVERFEPVYPGVSYQAWMGTQEVIDVNGQPALLLHAQDGQSYVLKHSIGYGEETRIGAPGDRVIIEGWLKPDETFGGYPVIVDGAGAPAEGISDLSQYTLASGRPYIIEEAQSTPTAATLTGRVTIERVELAYAGISLERCTAAQQQYLQDPAWAAAFVVQPIWVFTGRFDDGRLFELQIQALPDEYLK